MTKTIFDGDFDQLDQTILEELQANSRITVADLARKIHLSAPAVHQRIKRLERAGVIEKYAALLDREAVGYGLLCFIRVTIQPHNKTHLDGFQAAICQLSPVLEGYWTAGSFELLLKVAVADHKELDKFISEHLMTISGVERIETSPVLNVLKSTTELKLKK
jgi:DNA-binding Lrp family transcriptional regulator